MRLFIIIVMFLFLFSCSKGKKSGDFYQVIDRLSGIKTLDEAGDFYTAATIDAVNKASKKGMISPGDRLSMLPLFSAKTKIAVLDEKVSGNTALVSIRYVEHPVENMTGYDMNLKFVFQDGKWKIDFEKEITGVTDKFNRNREIDYIKEKASKY